MPEGRTRKQPEKDTYEPGPISRWNWRPGMKPRTAFNAGVLLSFVVLFLLGNVG